MEKIEFKYFKLLGLYCVILGALCAVLSLIPLFMPFFSLFFLPFLGCIIPFGILIIKDKLIVENVKTYALLGAVAGIPLCFGFFIIFTPFVWLISHITKSYYNYGITSLNLFLAVMFFVMIAGVYAITNSVTALIAGGIYTYFKEIKNGKNNRMD